MTAVSFKASKQDRSLISKIVERYYCSPHPSAANA